MRPDDSSLDYVDRLVVEARARELLDRAAAWDRFPTPIEDILAAAEVRLAPSSAFDPKALLEYIKGKAASVAVNIKSALAKVFGIYDSQEALIHIDSTVAPSKQNFLKLHETAHHNLPVHRRIFRIFEDCDKTLAPDVADQFEREANNFARYALFQGDGFAKLAADCPLEIKTPMRLAKRFGSSIYAAAREFARTHHRACLVYVLEPVEYIVGRGARATVRRIEASPSFMREFGVPVEEEITPNHPLARLLPVGRRMVRPTALPMTDKNGLVYDCIAEAFDTKFNVVILLYPKRALTTSTIIFPKAG